MVETAPVDPSPGFSHQDGFFLHGFTNSSRCVGWLTGETGNSQVMDIVRLSSWALSCCSLYPCEIVIDEKVQVNQRDMVLRIFCLLHL